MTVPSFDASREFDADRDALLAAAGEVLISGRYILGPEVEALEAEVAAYLGVRHAVGVASGTDALALALRALGVERDDQVAIPAFTFFATASAALNSGAVPVLADIEPTTFNIDPDSLERALQANPRVRAIVPVHLYGQPAAMEAIRELAKEHDAAVVEDAAQAFGAEYEGRKVGGLGDGGCLSFFPTKNLGGFGDGGMVTTDDDDVAERLRGLRAHGAARKGAHELVGTNSRLDALQAALLQARLSRIDERLAARRAHAAAYDAALADLEGVSVPVVGPDRLHTYNQYVIRVGEGRRDEVAEGLASRGVGTAVYYRTPVHLQPAASGLGHSPGDFPVAEAACGEVLALPIFPSLTAAERDRVVEALRGVLAE